MRGLKAKVLAVAFSGVLVMSLAGCAMTAPTSGIGGGVFVGVTEPVGVGTGKVGSGLKRGAATCTNILGIIVSGDCSINTAARKAGIKEISFVDKEVNNILGLFGRVTVVVYGY